jgi:hypothetical protein
MTDRTQQRLADPVPVPREDLAVEELDGETVIYDERTGLLHLLDQVATVVWGCFDGEGTLGELADELSEAFGTDAARVGADVVALVERLEGDGLLEGTEPPQTAAGDPVDEPGVFRPRPAG